MATDIRYAYGAPKEATAAEARRLVEAARVMVLGFKKKGLVKRVGPLLDHPSKMGEWGKKWFQAEDREQPGFPCWPRVTAIEGWMFEVEIGKGCGLLHIALCKYPTEYTAYDGVVIPTHIPPYYIYDGWVETEDAAEKGAEHFMRCHRAVIEIIEKLQEVGFLIKMEDKAGYWPNHSVKNLQAAADKLTDDSGPTWGLQLLNAMLASLPKSKAKGKGKVKKAEKKPKAKKAVSEKTPLFLHERYKTARSAKPLSEAEKEALRNARKGFGGN